MADFVGLTSSIVQLLFAVKEIVGYLNDIKHCPQERSLLVKEIGNLVPILEDLRNRIDHADLNDPWIDNLRILDRPAGPVARFKDALDRLEKSLAPRFSTAALKNRLTWSVDKKHIREWLDETERFKTYLLLALQNDQMLLSRAIKDDTSKISSINTTMNVVLQNIAGLGNITGEQALKAKLHEIVDWLSPLDFRDDHNAFFELHLESSNKLVLESDFFRNWCAGLPKVLCCVGESGSGKTTLVSQIVEHLKTLFPNYPVLYAYCQFSRKASHSPCNFLGALLRQLIQFEGKIPQELHNLYEKYERQGTKPSVANVISLLKAKLELYPASFIIIDALDQYSSVQDVLLKKLSLLQGNVRMFFTSTATYLDSWLDRMQSLGFSSIMGFEFQATPQDIELYVREHLTTLPPYLIDDVEMVQIIQERVVSGAAGRFLIAVLCISLLRDCTTKKEGRLVLQRLINQDSLSALDELYKQTLERIQVQDSGFRKLAERVLSWLAQGFGALGSIHELQHALGVEPGTTKLDKENITDIDTIVRACLGMVVFDSTSQMIRFVHDSAAKFVSSHFYRESIGTHCEIVETCLTYLSFEVFNVGPCSTDEELESRLNEYPFLTYASNFWGEHAIECVENIALVDDRCMKLRSTILDYLSRTENKTLVAQVEYGKSFDHLDSTNYPRNLSSLHVASSFGLTSIMNHLLTEGADYNIRDSYGCTPLNRASRRGHEWAIRLLLESGADIHIQDNYGQDALHMASWNGHILAVEMLMEYGANTNAKDNEGQTALHKAAAQGHQEIVVHLTKKGADLNVQDNASYTPVHLALREGHEALKWPMLQSWIKNLDLEDYRRPPLHQAVRYGSTDHVKQILDDGHGVDELDFCGRTALLEAARYGLLSMVKLLVESGANVRAEGQNYTNISLRENAVSLAADSCYLFGKKDNEAVKKGQRREDAISIIQLVLQKLIATCGLSGGLRMPLGLEENKEKINLAISETRGDAELLQLATKLVLQEASYRDSKRPRIGGSRFE